MPRSRNIRLNLDPAAQLELKRLTQLPSTPAVVYRRARAILLLATGMRYREVARLADLDRANIFRWTKRYMACGVAGLRDLARKGSGRPKFVTATNAIPTSAMGESAFARSLREIHLRNTILASEGLLEQQQGCTVDVESGYSQTPALTTRSTHSYGKADVVPHSDGPQVV